MKRIFKWLGGAIVLFYVVLVLINLMQDLPPDATDLDTSRHQTVAVFGATGTVGDGLLKAAMADPDVEHIHVITRRPSPRIEAGVASGKVTMTIHRDYLDYTAIRDLFAEVDSVLWGIGITSVGMDEATYREIHVTYPKNFVAEWLAVSESDELSFHYVSGGSTREDSSMMWSREKARAERELREMAEGTKLRTISYRPAVVTPTEAEINIGFKIAHVIFAPVKFAVRAEAVGGAMLEISARGTQVANGTILENADIVDYGELYAARQQ